jgi:type I restriction enzyme S subunit
MSELPDGWAVVPAGELGEWRGGGTPSKSNDAFWRDGTIPWVSPKDMKRQYISDAEDHITEAAIAGSATNRIPENSILMVTRSGILQHSLPVAINTVSVTVNQDLKALSPFEGILPAYILRHLQADAQRILEAASKTGTTVESIDFDRLKAYPIRLAPLPEQKRIVAKVDGLTARTARARADLDRIPTLIARYKQRLLALAFSGELIGKEPAEGKLPETRCWNIPRDWKWVRFDEVAEIASNLVAPDSIPNLPHIAPDNIESGTARLLPYRTVSEDGLISAKNRFYPGQVLYSKIRPYLRKAVIVDFDGACSADMYPINVRSVLEPKYLLYWLISDDFARFTALHEGRTVLPKINQKALNGTPFPLPPLDEQTETVRRVEFAFNWLDRMAADHAAAARLLPKLDAAILAKAFRGELVPQDPNDEPASTLMTKLPASKYFGKSARTTQMKSGPSGRIGPAMRVITLPKGNQSMTKSRQDEDVMGKPYLANLLKEGHCASAQDLFKAADLPVADFYKQLAWEIANKHIRDDDEKLEAL